MQINITSPNFENDMIAKQFVTEIENKQNELAIRDATLYYEFPLFKNLDELPEYPKFMFISPNHGILLVQCDERSYRSLSQEEMKKLNEYLTQIYSTIYSIMIKYPVLRKKRNHLKFELYTVLYLPNYGKALEDTLEDDVLVLTSFGQLSSFLSESITNPLDQDTITNLISIIEGTRAIPKPKNRNITEESRNSKGGFIMDPGNRTTKRSDLRYN